MKKIIMFLLCLTAVVGLQAQEAIPYTQDFESSSSLPTGWTHVGSGTAACAASYPHAGSKSLKFSGATANNVVALPTFAQEIANLEIVFWTRPEGTSSSGNFDIGYLTNAADASTFVAVETYNCATEGTTYKEKIVTFAGAPTGAVMALRHRSGSTAWYWFVDDVDVHTAPTCLPVFNIATDNLAARSVDLMWSSTSSAEYVGTITPAIDGVSEWNSYDTIYSFSDLTPETRYTVTITSVCGAGDTSRTVSYSFTTPASCPPVSDFVVIAKTTTSATIGWTAGGEESEWVGTISPDIDGVSEWNASDTNISFEDLTPETNYTLTVRAVCGPDDTSAVRTYSFFTGYCAPNPTSVDGDGITNVQFGVGDSVVNNSNRPTSSPYYGNYSNLVGQVPAGTDAIVNITYNTSYTYGTIIWVDWNNNMTFDGNEVVYVGESDDNEPTTLTATFHVSDTMPLGNYRMRIAGADSYFDSYTSSISAAANANPCFSSNYSIVHDYTLQVSEAPACFPVSNVQVFNYTTTDSIYATWESPESTTAWDLYLTTNSADVPNSETTDVITSSDTSYLFDPLSADSTYYLYVRGNCGGDVSSWSFAVSFHPGLYIMAATGSDTITACGATITDNGGLNGNYGNSCNSTLVIYPSSPDSSVAISGTYIGEGCCDYLKIYDGVGTAGTQFCNIMSPSSGTEVIVGPFISTTGPLTIVFTSDGSGAYDGYELHARCLFRPACDQPTNFVSTYSNGDTVSLAWNGSSASSYQVVYGTMGFDPDNAEDPITITDTAYTLTGLPMGQSLDFYVRADCGSEQSWWAGPVTVMTGFFYNMQSTGTDSLVGCGYIITDAGGPNGPYMSSSNSTLYIFPDQEGNTIQLSGSSYTESSWDYLRIYDGYGTSGTLLFDDYGVSTLQNFGPFISEEGVVTVVFVSDGSVTYDGYSIATSCIPLPNCVRPNQFTLEGVTDVDATFSWNERGTATSWTLEYGPAGFTSGSEDATIESVNTNPATITGLTPNTQYDVYLRADCGGEESLPQFMTFRTACTAIDSLPYIYGFEDATSNSASGQINPCWRKGVTSNSSTAYPYPQSTAASGTHSLYFYGYYSSSIKSWAVMPMFEEELAGLQVSFKLRRSSSTDSYYGHYLTVGVMNNPNDISTFTPIETFEATSTTDWDDFTCYLAAYEGTGRYIAFLSEGHNSTQYYNYVYLDDVVVDYAPECGPVVNINVNAGPYSAIATWTPSSVGTYNGANVEYKLQSDSAWTSATTATNYIALTGLEAASNYDLRVSNVCVDGEGTPVYATFSTGVVPCAVMDSASLIDVTIGTDATTSTYIPSYSFYNYGYSQQIFLASEMNATGNNVITKLSIQVANVATSRNWDIYLTNVSDNSVTSWRPVSASDLVWSGTTNFTANSWNEITLDVPFTYNGSQNIMLTIDDNTGSYTSGNSYYTTSSSNASMYVYNDGTNYVPGAVSVSGSTLNSRNNVKFFGGSCVTPATCIAPPVQITDVTPYTVDIAWAAGNTETSWNVYYKRAVDASYTLAGTATSNTYTFTSLSPATPYEFKVEAGCTEGASTEVSATTLCAPINALPFTENFDNWGAGSGVVPNCWNREGSYSSYPYISTSTGAGYDHTTGTGHSLYMYTYGASAAPTFVMMPEIDSTLGPVNQMQAVFYMNYPSTSSYVHAVIVGVCDESGISSFVPVDTVAVSVTGTNNWEIFEVPLTNYTGNGRYITFRGYAPSSYAYPYIDDLTIEFTPTCPRPDSLAAANATTNSVDLSWRERGGASDWIIEYGPVGFTLGTGTTVPANSNPFTLSGIPASYDGEFYVRSICSSTDTGDYSRVGCRFSTTQIPATLPYSYNFEDAAEWANWQTNSNSTINWYRGNADAGDGSYSMYVSADQGATVGNNGFSSTVNASAFRDIDFGTVDSSFTFTFKAKVGGTTTAAYDALMVFLVDPSVPVVAPTANITSPWGSVNDLYRIATVRVDTTWNTYTASFDNISGVHRVAFFWFNQNTASSQPFIGGPAEVDSISIDYSACPRPTELEVVSTGASSASVTWRGPASASYEIVYRPYPNGTANTTVYSNTNSYTFTGLDSLTQYAFWVRKICGTDSSLYSDGELFTTALCDGAVYAYNYDSTSTFTTTDYIPAYAYYNYGASQTIIDSADLAVLDGAEISAFAFTTNSGTNGEYYTDCEVYLMHTTMNEFTSEDPVDLDSAVLVYQGDLTFSDAGVQMFGFDTTFVWDGHSNVILTILRHHGSYGSSSSYVFEAVEKSSDKGLYAYSDSYDPVAPSLTSYSGYIYTTNVVAAYQLIACGAGCPTPVIVSTIPTYNSAAITWSSNATNFEVSYKSVSDADFTTPVAVAANTYTLTGLTPATQYTVRVRSLCDSGAVSDWASANFVTDSLPCFAPEDLHQTALTYTTVTLDWTNGGNEQNWVVKVFNSRIGEILDTVSAHPATISGLTANEQYFATVQAACGSNLDGFSDWSDTISFTTTECVAVSNISCATPTNSSVEITWTSNGSESAWIVEYGMPGFGQGEEIGRATATTNPYQLSLAGLDPNTTYEVYVYAQCMEGLTSVPAGPASFTTNDIGISGISGNADINIYPNPTTGSTTISVSGISGKVNVAIVDMNGREVMNSAMECDGDCEKVMNVEGLAQGAYFVRIYGEEINSIRKLIVR